jgi:hypothetical protein
MTGVDDNKLTALEAEVDQLVEQIADAVNHHDDEAVLACEQQVDQLLAQLDLLLGPSATLH